MSAPLKSARSWAHDPSATWNDPAICHGEPARVLMSNGEWLVPESERPQIAPAPVGYRLSEELKRVREEELECLKVVGWTSPRSFHLPWVSKAA